MNTAGACPGAKNGPGFAGYIPSVRQKVLLDLGYTHETNHSHD